MLRKQFFCITLWFLLSPVITKLPEKIKIHPKFNATSELLLLRRIKGADIKSWMNLNIDPCKDFYDYVCGNWKRIYATQATVEGSVNRFSVIHTDMNRRAEEFLQNLNTNDMIQRKIYDFQQSCRNTRINRSDYGRDLRKLLSEYGSFHFGIENQEEDEAEEEEEESNFNWWLTNAKLFKNIGKGLFISLGTSHHFKTRERIMIFMQQLEASISQLKLMATRGLIMEFYNATSDEVDQLVDDFLQLEEEIESIIHSNTVDFDEERYSLMNVSEVRDLYKDLFDVEEYIKVAFITDQVPQEIYVEKTDYFQNLSKIFKKTKPETLENYMLWQIMEDYVMDGIPMRDIETICLEKTKFYFAQYLEHILYQEFRSKEFEQELKDMWVHLTAAFRAKLESDTTYTWMSQATRKEAIRKVNKMRLIIRSYDHVNFEKYFQELKITSLNFVENIKNIMELFEKWRGNKLGIQTESIEGIIDDAYSHSYDSEQNYISIPVATFLPFRLWHPSYPKFILYSDLGNILAHELMHAFDDSNRQYDSEGNAQMWWNPMAIEMYNLKRNCFQAQYHSFILWGQRVRNMTDQSENISDNAAVHIAFDAYQRWLEANEAQRNSELLDNLPFNREELFFINFGQSRCEAITKSILFQTMEDDTHAPDVLRVVVPLANYPKFSEVFQCPLNSSMNPIWKCVLY